MATSYPNPDQEIGSLENKNNENFSMVPTAPSSTRCLRSVTTKVSAYFYILRSTLSQYGRWELEVESPKKSIFPLQHFLHIRAQ